MPTSAFCVHGHFYQPPREDPLTGVIPVEPGAAPYANWNERIHAECYRPNAELGNFAKISFNMGPTLMTWMAGKDPVTYARIIAQDRENYTRHGVGNAMAQSYNHTILPLANRLGKITQVRWGIADYEYRFGHRPRGLWLPETAVDSETLSILVDEGIEYTVLAPWQAADYQGDTSLPCWVELPGKRRIAVFFYNQDLSTRVSFDPGATINADSFLVDTLVPRYERKSDPDGTQLFMLASDGELYGHHQKFRDKFLDYLLDGAARSHGIELTYPGLWLQEHPPGQTVKIRENTSWSCHHGLVRWMGECDCTPGSRWKAPLRKGLSHLAALLDNVYFNAMVPLVPDPWELRHRYIHVILGELTLAELVKSAAGKPLTETDLARVKRLLAAQYERQRMFTSCGWFFDEFDRIEPKNNVAYAAQAVWLTYKATGIDLTGEALDSLKDVKSRRTGLKGETVFTQKYSKAKNANSDGADYFSAARTSSS
jgi:alpha-amylase/alpha-mannosidase (GH57 family)